MAGNDGKILVLIDMNGTMCYRNEEPVRGVQSDLCIRRKHFYGRGGIQKFIRGIFDTKKFKICVYTSMMKHNAIDGLEAILGTQLIQTMVEKVFDRTMNKADPNGENDWDTIRDMKKIWKKFPGFGPARTVLLDNEARKFKETPRNGIVVPEYGEAEVRRRTTSTLDDLFLYLEKLGEVNPSDVREYMGVVEFKNGWENITFRGDGAEDDASDEDDTSSSQEELDDMFLNLAVDDSNDDGGEDTGTAKARAEARPDLKLESLPDGTSVEFCCLDGLDFVMRGKTNEEAKEKVRFFRVRGKVVEGVRVEKKMNVKLLSIAVGPGNLTITEDGPGARQ